MERRSRAATIFCLIVFAAVFLHEAADTSESQAEQSRTLDVSKCQEMARSLGISRAALDDLVRRATPGEILRLQQACEASYPKRSPNAAAIERGRVLFTTYSCGACHGQGARGGDSGPSLLRSQLVMRDRSGETIAPILLKGVPGTRMPAFPLSSTEISDLSEFLHSLQTSSESTSAPASSPAVGNANDGKRYFDRKCIGCHRITPGRERVHDQELDARTLQRMWLMPTSAHPRTATIFIRGSSVIEGELLRIDEFLVTVGFSEGTQRTFRLEPGKLDVRIRDPLEGHKALLSDYTDRDIHDVTAYLVMLHRSKRTVEAAVLRSPTAVLHPLISRA